MSFSGGDWLYIYDGNETSGSKKLWKFNLQNDGRNVYIFPTRERLLMEFQILIRVLSQHPSQTTSSYVSQLLCMKNLGGMVITAHNLVNGYSLLTGTNRRLYHNYCV